MISGKSRRSWSELHRLFGRSLSIPVGSLLVMGALGLFILLFLHNEALKGADVSRSRGNLLASFGPMRLVEGRLVGLRYAPLGSRRAIKAPIRVGAETVRELKRSAFSGHTPEPIAKYSLIKVLDGDLDGAVAILDTAASASEWDAELASDKSAIYLELGRRDPQVYVEALLAADQAARWDNSLPEAKFNLALALGHLGLERAARAVWEEYFALETDQEWLREGRMYYSQLKAPSSEALWQKKKESLRRALERGDSATAANIISRYSQFVRLYAEEELLALWARKLLAGDRVGAERVTALISQIGSIQAQLHRDRMVLDVAAGIQRAPEASLLQLARGYLDYKHGLGLLAAGDFSGARRSFRLAHEQLVEEESPFAGWASFQLAYCHYRQAQDSEAIAVLAPLEQWSAAAGYVPLSGRSAWLAGTIKLIQSLPLESLQSYRSALSRFERASEVGHQVAVHTMLANNLSYLGDERGAWLHRIKALTGLTQVEDLHRKRVSVSEAAYALLESGKPREALLFQNEAIAIAKESKDPTALAMAHRQRALILHQNGDMTASLSELDKMKMWTAKIVDSEARHATASETLYFEGKVRGALKPQAGIEKLEEAERFHRDTEYAFLLPDILLAKAKLQLSRGKIDAAESDLREAVKERENHLQQKSPSFYRLSHLADSREFFDELVLALVRGRRDSFAALETDERSRMHVLLEDASGLGISLSRARKALTSDPFSLEDAQTSMGDATAFLVYRIIGKSIFMWVVRNNRVVFHEARVDEQRLDRLIQAMAGAAESSSRRWLAISSLLNRILIKPISSALPTGGTIVVVPDGDLARLPFSLLFDENDGRFLVERFAVSIAPSIRFSLYANSLALEQQAEEWRMLGVAATEFNRTVFPHLSALPGAAEEVEATAVRFPLSKTLLGASATQDSVLSEMPRATIVHLASHGVENQRNPFLSAILLSPEKRSPLGALYAYELLGIPIGRTRLVVLSGCRTGVLRAQKGQASVSLALALAASGVPAIVASYWNVEDASSSKFFDEFYASLVKVKSPVLALRHAKLALLDRNNPKTWGSFEIVGGPFH